MSKTILHLTPIIRFDWPRSFYSSKEDPLSLSLKHPSLKIGDKLSELRLLANNNIIFRSMSILSTIETLASRSFQQN